MIETTHKAKLLQKPVPGLRAGKRPQTWRPSSSRRQGIAVIYTALFLPVFLGLMGLVVDLGLLYTKRANAQKAADAAALAGAIRLMKGESQSLGIAAGHEYAGRNGYVSSTYGPTVGKTANATVVCTPNWSGNPNLFRADVTRSEKLLFMGLFKMFSSNVGASAVAQYTIATPLDSFGFNINPGEGDSYGVMGAASLSVFGPYGAYSNGDAISVQWLDNGAANPDYDANGYDFNLVVPSTYESTNGTPQVMVEIFDPGCSNNGGGPAN
ncbi:MAG: pilus assembly protein TadG-related protein, partial [Armatimonadota bacterium]|nr:pilus assembly protein TadG-related protein [Armatimonadota bacterium]